MYRPILQYPPQVSPKWGKIWIKKTVFSLSFRIYSLHRQLYIWTEMQSLTNLGQWAFLFSPTAKKSGIKWILHIFQFSTISITVWNVSKYGVFSGPYFPTFGLNTERYQVSLHIQSECGKIRTRKSSIFGPFSRSK